MLANRALILALKRQFICQMHSYPSVGCSQAALRGKRLPVRKIRGASLVEKGGHNVILFMQLSAELVVLASALMQPQFTPGASYTLWGDGTRVCLLFKNRSQPCHRKH